jgi:hypothetical protein
LDGACRVGERFLVCRYEDLVTHPEPVLHEVVGFLGEAWCPALLESHPAPRGVWTAALPPDADPVELARQLARVRAALERTRSRRAVRVAYALRLVQHGKSVAAGRAA